MVSLNGHPMSEMGPNREDPQAEHIMSEMHVRADATELAHSSDLVPIWRRQLLHGTLAGVIGRAGAGCNLGVLRDCARLVSSEPQTRARGFRTTCFHD